MNRPTIAIWALALASQPAIAAEPTLNELPAILSMLRDCKTSTGVLGRYESCRFPDVWVSVRSSGQLTIYYQNRETGIDVTGSGATVGAMLRDLAGKLNRTGADAKSTLERLAPLLPTQ